MAGEEEKPPAIGGGWSGTFQEATEEARKRRLLAIANICRLVRRPDGRELSDLAIAARVKGTTLAEVRYVRAELDRNGVLPEELDGTGETEGGGAE